MAWVPLLLPRMELCWQQRVMAAAITPLTKGMILIPILTWIALTASSARRKIVRAFRAQLLNSHNGKLLRIDPVTGNGVSSNPYYSAAQPRSPKSRVWAFGLRNPYRFSIKAGTGSTNPAAGDVGEIYVGDVGWNTYEEVSIITKGGVNCGWPLFEGLTAQPGYTSAVTANLDEPNPLYGISGCTKQYFNFQDLIKQVTADNNKTVYNSCNPATVIGTGDRYVHYRPAIEWKHFTNEARVGTFTGNTASVAIIGTPESNVIGTPFPGNCATRWSVV